MEVGEGVDADVRALAVAAEPFLDDLLVGVDAEVLVRPGRLAGAHADVEDLALERLGLEPLGAGWRPERQFEMPEKG